MLFRLLLIIAIFYAARSVVVRLLSREDRGKNVKGKGEVIELDPSKYDIEDAEYQDLDEESRKRQ